jgi:hypothetical protein
MSYYIGKINNNEFLILKNQNKIKFSFETTCFQGTKQFYQTNYLNVLNIDNFIYNLEIEIDDYLKKNRSEFTNYELKSNIIFNNKQFLQFKVDKNVNILPDTKLFLDIEVDKIKLNKNNIYQIVLKLINYKILT